MTRDISGKNILILGVGNILLADEGFGVRALYWLRENYRWPENTRLVDGATLGLLLMGELLECDLAIILDIAQGGEKPGTFYVLENENLGRSLSMGQSMHQTGIEDVLISCDLAGHRPEALVFGFEPFDFQSPKAELSPEARALLPEFCDRVVEELGKMGLEIIKKMDSQPSKDACE